MKMFALQDIERGFPAQYFLTLDEALEAQAKARIHGRGWVRRGAEAEDITVVDRPNQTCEVCGGQAENKPDQFAKYPYCRHCHYTGSAAERIRQDQLNYMRRRLDPYGLTDVAVWHTGGGCFGLGITFPGYVYFCTDGEASLPESEDGKPIRGAWGYCGAFTQEQYDDQDYENSDTLIDYGWDMPEDGGKSDRQLIDAIIKHRKGVLTKSN